MRRAATVIAVAAVASLFSGGKYVHAEEDRSFLAVGEDAPAGAGR